MDDQELAEFERDYNRWCLEVELENVQTLNKTVNQNSYYGCQVLTDQL
jgi:hypothetical protein